MGSDIHTVALQDASGRTVALMLGSNRYADARHIVDLVNGDKVAWPRRRSLK